MAASSRSRPTRTPRSRRHQPEEARAEIARAAVQFLSEQPFRALSVGELMAGTSLSRPAFYQYFRDLHELLESLLRVVQGRIGEVANPWLAGEGDPPTALRESLRGLVQVCVEHGPIVRAVAQAAPFDERLERAWSSFMAHWDDVVSARIEAQQASGLIPACEARRLANALNTLDAALLSQAFGRHPQDDSEAVLETLHRIWFGALYGRA